MTTEGVRSSCAVGVSECNDTGVTDSSWLFVLIVAVVVVAVAIWIVRARR